MSGATKFRQEGKACRDCHDGEEKKIGSAAVTGTVWKDEKGGDHPPIESKPIAGKPGWLAATVKLANDGTNLYVHLDFKEGTQPDAKQNPGVATMVSVMFSAAKTADITRGGCFSACHDDATAMPSNKGEQRTMYLAGTRARLTRQGGGDALKPAADLAKLRADGYFMEYWKAELNPGQPAKAYDGIIFDKRTQESGAVTAEATFAGGGWSVTLSRKLAGTGGTAQLRPRRALRHRLRDPRGAYRRALPLHFQRTRHGDRHGVGRLRRGKEIRQRDPTGWPADAGCKEVPDEKDTARCRVWWPLCHDRVADGVGADEALRAGRADDLPEMPQRPAAGAGVVVRARRAGRPALAVRAAWLRVVSRPEPRTPVQPDRGAGRAVQRPSSPRRRKCRTSSA